MGLGIRLVFWLLTAISFGYNFHLWGGLDATPVIGKQLLKEAPFESPLAATYMYLGRKIGGTLGTRDAAVAFAARKFPEFTSQPELVQTLAVRRFVSAQGAWASLCYYLAPILLVLSFVLHAMRQKQVRSLGRTG